MPPLWRHFAHPHKADVWYLVDARWVQEAMRVQTQCLISRSECLRRRALKGFVAVPNLVAIESIAQKRREHPMVWVSCLDWLTNDIFSWLCCLKMNLQGSPSLRLGDMVPCVFSQKKNEYIYIYMLWGYYLGQVWPFEVLLSGPSLFFTKHCLSKNTIKIGVSALWFLEKIARANLRCYYLGQVGHF